MTRNRDGKAAARERCARTGESYQTAQRAIQNGEPEPPPRGPCGTCGPHPLHRGRCQVRFDGQRCLCAGLFGGEKVR